MLDPKEYATQLAEKYFVEFDDLSLSEAKECALIDVQNTIDALTQILNQVQLTEGTHCLITATLIENYDQVKEHIKQL